MKEWIPNYIRRVFDYEPHQILSAKELNAVLNLIVTQGDYNSEWLDYLQTQGIPDIIANLNSEQIKEILTDAISAEINALAASIVNKTSAHLNNPLFSVVNFSIQADTITEFQPVLDNMGIKGCLTSCTTLIGKSAAYPSLQQLQAAQLTGHDIISSGTDTAPYNLYTSVNKVVSAKSYMQNNGLTAGINTIIYPKGSTMGNTLYSTVEKCFNYAIRRDAESTYIDSDNFNPMEVRTLHINADNTIDTDAVKNVIDETLKNNYWCIIDVDTSTSSYSEEALIGVLEYIQQNLNAKIVTISEAEKEVEDTINNRIKTLKDSLNGCYVDFKNESGNTTTEKYLHW